MSALVALVLCFSPVVSDGDTFRCKNDANKYRMAGIDAPDKTCRARRAGNCFLLGPKGDWTVSRTALRKMLRRGNVKLQYFGVDPYGRRIVTVCARDGNINARMVKLQFAIAKPTWTGRGLKVICQ